MAKLTLSVLKNTLSICKLNRQSKMPNWLSIANCPFISITKTEDELSIVCDQSIIPEKIEDMSIVRDWRALKIEGPLDFSLTGILSALLHPLAKQQISIFTVSTYDTDYILVKEQDLTSAIEVLKEQYIVLA
ncbi:MAG: ACT domain-containing protein [Gammaproteobacteria bacterium]